MGDACGSIHLFFFLQAKQVAQVGSSLLECSNSHKTSLEQYGVLNTQVDRCSDLVGGISSHPIQLIPLDDRQYGLGFHMHCAGQKGTYMLPLRSLINLYLEVFLPDRPVFFLRCSTC